MSNGVILINAGDRVQLVEGGRPPLPKALIGTWATVKRFSGYSSVWVETDVPSPRGWQSNERKVKLSQIGTVDRGNGQPPERVPWLT